MSVTVKLEEIMSEREISCAELSKEIGIPAPDISLLRTGKARAVKFTTLDKLCKALDCSISDLLEFTKDE